MGKIVVVPYQPQWSEQFSALKQVVAATLGDQYLSIEHIGSTSIPGLSAKPVIDMDVVVEDERQLQQVIDLLSGIGYAHRGNLGVEGREAFARADECCPTDGKGTKWPKHHLYVCIQGSEGLRNHLGLRDHLLANPAEAIAYGALKMGLAEQYPDDMEMYLDGKTNFILAILEKAGLAEEELDSISRINKQKA